MSRPEKVPRVVVVGSGFAGFHCARTLDRRLGRAANLSLINSVDHMVYSALLPDVVGGVVDPKSIATPLAASLSHTNVVVGTVTSVDLDRQTCTVDGVENRGLVLGWDRLVLNPGSVSQTFGIKGVEQHAHGFKTLSEALFLRERILSRLQLAATTNDPTERERHASFVVVGGGFTGLELAAQGRALARRALRQHPGLNVESVRWTVIEAGKTVLDQFPERLARRAVNRLESGGVQVRIDAPVAEVESDQVRLENGESISTDTVVWTAGVTPPPLISQLGLGLDHGRLIVDDWLKTPDHPNVFALGDAAAVPDITEHGQPAAQTAQNAQRQGVAAARNVAASLGYGKARVYKHRNLGFVVDLTGRNAIATPLGLKLSGVSAEVAGRAYHLRALPSGRLRVLSEWVNALLSGRQIVEIGLIDERYATIEAEDDGGSEPEIPRPAGRTRRRSSFGAPNVKEKSDT
ncbi:MAG TPA: NAD(P)/FAD-dependent oxidoreductase [Acidimicrobiales bacterium]|nr:NAD(P)/FAD-dependent oxidoreductase [Acidimicrobiales bacterium]